MTTSISSKGQLVLPAELRKKDGIEAGQTFEIVRLEAGKYRITRRQPKKTRGLSSWLRKCPVKGFFVPLESESTDTL